MSVYLEMEDEAALEHGLSCLMAHTWMPQLVDQKDLLRALLRALVQSLR